MRCAPSPPRLPSLARPPECVLCGPARPPTRPAWGVGGGGWRRAFGLEPSGLLCYGSPRAPGRRRPSCGGCPRVPVAGDPHRRQPGKEATGMNRRSALLLSMLLGGLAPRRLLAQTPGGEVLDQGPRPGRVAVAVAAVARRGHPGPGRARAVGRRPDPPNLPNEPGQQWQRFDISRYTGLAHSQNNPQNAIIEWIFRRTGSAPWHGEKVAVLGASRTQLRAYHSPSLAQAGRGGRRAVHQRAVATCCRSASGSSRPSTPAGGTPSIRTWPPC